MRDSRRLSAARYGIVALASLALVAVLLGARWSTGSSAQIRGTDKEKLYLAEQVMIQRCMANLGFRYWIVPFGDLPVMTFQSALAVPSLAAARIRGYHPASAPPFNQGSATETYYNWAGSCANLDESLNNNIAQPGYPGLTRVYFTTFEGGAWMCMNGGDYIDDVSKGHNNGPYRFDQGTGLAGYKQSIWHNIASSEIDVHANCITDE